MLSPVPPEMPVERPPLEMPVERPPLGAIVLWEKEEVVVVVVTFEPGYVPGIG